MPIGGATLNVLWLIITTTIIINSNNVFTAVVFVVSTASYFILAVFPSMPHNDISVEGVTISVTS